MQVALDPATAVLPIQQEQTEPLKDLVNAFAQEVLKAYEMTWRYLGKALLAIKFSVKALASGCKSCEEWVRPFAASLSLFAVFSVLNDLRAIPKQFEQIAKSTRLQDIEGIVLGILGAVMLCMDLVDSVDTVLTGISVLAGGAFAWIAIVGRPFLWALSGIGIISRLIKIGITAELRFSLGSVRNQSHAEILKFIDGRLSTELDRIKMVRRTSEKVVRQMEKLRVILKDESVGADLKDRAVKQVFDNACKVSERKMAVDAVGILANAIMITGMALFSVAMPAAIPFAFLAGGTLTRMGIAVYEDTLQKQNLNRKIFRNLGAQAT